MRTAWPKDRFWRRTFAAESQGSEWPVVRFGAIGEAWRLYRRHWGVWSLTMLVALLCSSLAGGLGVLVVHAATLGMLGGLAGVGAPGVPVLPVVLGAIIGGFFLGGMIRMAINQIRGRAPRVEDLFNVTDVWFDLVLGSGLLALVLYVGMHLLVLPGLIAGGMLMFTYPLIVDGRLPATGAMIRSFHVLQSQWLAATVVHLPIAALAGFGVLTGGIVGLVTGPVYALSIAVLYRDLFLSPYAAAWLKPGDPFRDY